MNNAITINQCADILNISRQRVAKLITQYKLKTKPHPHTRMKLVYLSDIEKLQNRNKKPGRPKKP